MDLDYYYKLARFLFIIVLVVGAGVFAVNQILAYRYKAEFLKSPCQLCKDLNPNVTKCIDNCFEYMVNLYPDGLGGWRDNTGKCYDSFKMPANCTRTNISMGYNDIRISLT